MAGAPLVRKCCQGGKGFRERRFVNGAGSETMDEVSPRALRTLKSDYRQQALAWVAANVHIQQLSDEKTAMMHHIGRALDFTAAEVEAEIERCFSSREGAS